jgi:hypothetical protein
MVPLGKALLSLYLLLISIQPRHVASRGKPKPTKSPTIIPSAFPSTSPPSLFASSTPTRGLSELRTEYPTKSPTGTHIPSPNPTIRPSTSPLANTAGSLQIPSIQMTLMLSRADMSIPLDVLQEKLTSFITILFETKSGIEALDMVSLEFDIVPSSFVNHNVDSGFSIKIDGIIYHHNGAPFLSRERLQENMSECFSSGGIEDLEAFLHGHSFESAKVGELYIDGILVIIYNESEDKKIDSRHNKSDIDIDKKWKTLVASLGGVAALLVISCSFYWRSRQKHRVGAPNANRTLFAKLRSQSSSEGTENGSLNFGGEIAVHFSLNESEMALPHQHDMSTRSYDARRLDRVILEAKNHASTSSASRK